MLSKKFRGGTPSPDGVEIAIGTGMVTFDILKNTRELNGMCMILWHGCLAHNYCAGTGFTRVLASHEVQPALFIFA
jgi:hypothetical protein